MKLTPKTNGSDRRRGGRLVCEGITCQYGQVADLSCTGMKLLTRKLPQIEVGTKAVMRFTGINVDVLLPAELTRVTKRKDGWFDCGFRFPDLDTRQRATLAQLARIAADRRVLRAAA